MSIVKFFNVENGDMCYIDHNSDNFSIIDCNLKSDNINSDKIISELANIKSNKGVSRFISTHPDEDHFHGISSINEEVGIDNFYCVKNKVSKDIETDDFKVYKNLRDSDKAFYIKKGCIRKWMNLNDEERGSSGINILWPDIDNQLFSDELKKCDSNITSPNNLSPIITYSIENNAKFMFMGDIETNFLESIKDNIKWPSIDVLLAPHHGRKSGHIPSDILDLINPKLIILGHASDSKDMDYYSKWNTILKMKSGDITIDCIDNKVHIGVENNDYTSNIKSLNKNERAPYSLRNKNYIGSIKV